MHLLPLAHLQLRHPLPYSLFGQCLALTWTMGELE